MENFLAFDVYLLEETTIQPHSNFCLDTGICLELPKNHAAIFVPRSSSAKKGINIYEYTPLQVKQAVVGYGRADKKQVQTMVKTLMNLKTIPKLDDTTDAMAIAICHAHSCRYAETIK